ncbi:MAG: hypothetical protein IT381_05565 [Deltaproteobacteria bacterium]|nr:hypothetical protein [Deltaproteobacteria bacterium]
MIFGTTMGTSRTERLGGLGGDTSMSDVHPRLAGPDGAILGEVSVSGPFGDARAEYASLSNGMCVYNFAPGPQAGPGSPGRGDMFDMLLVRVLRANGVPPSRISAVARELCHQNESLRTARAAFVASTSPTTPVAIPPFPRFDGSSSSNIA